MRKSSMIVVAIGLATALSIPVFGMTLAAPETHYVAQILKREPLDVKLLPPLQMRTEWYGGAVIPIRVIVSDPDEGGVAGATVGIWVNDLPGTSPGSVDMNNMLKDLGRGVYMFNLDTKPYQAGPGSQPIKIVISASAPDDHTGQLEKFVTLN